MDMGVNIVKVNIGILMQLSETIEENEFSLTAWILSKCF